MAEGRNIPVAVKDRTRPRVRDQNFVVGQPPEYVVGEPPIRPDVAEQDFVVGFPSTDETTTDTSSFNQDYERVKGTRIQDSDTGFYVLNALARATFGIAGWSLTDALCGKALGSGYATSLEDGHVRFDWRNTDPYNEGPNLGNQIVHGIRHIAHFVDNNPLGRVFSAQNPFGERSEDGLYVDHRKWESSGKFFTSGMNYTNRWLPFFVMAIAHAEFVEGVEWAWQCVQKVIHRGDKSITEALFEDFNPVESLIGGVKTQIDIVTRRAGEDIFATGIGYCWAREWTGKLLDNMPFSPEGRELADHLKKENILNPYTHTPLGQYTARLNRTHAGIIEIAKTLPEQFRSPTESERGYLIPVDEKEAAVDIAIGFALSYNAGAPQPIGVFPYITPFSLGSHLFQKLYAGGAQALDHGWKSLTDPNYSPPEKEKSDHSWLYNVGESAYVYAVTSLKYMGSSVGWFALLRPWSSFRTENEARANLEQTGSGWGNNPLQWLDKGFEVAGSMYTMATFKLVHALENIGKQEEKGLGIIDRFFNERLGVDDFTSVYPKQIPYVPYIVGVAPQPLEVGPFKTNGKMVMRRHYDTPEKRADLAADYALLVQDIGNLAHKLGQMVGLVERDAEDHLRVEAARKPWDRELPLVRQNQTLVTGQGL